MEMGGVQLDSDSGTTQSQVRLPRLDDSSSRSGATINSNPAMPLWKAVSPELRTTVSWSASRCRGALPEHPAASGTC